LARKFDRRIGAHTSINGGLERAAEETLRMGCNTFQIFSHSPRMWRQGKLAESSVEQLKRLRAEHDLRPLVIHGAYLINMAAADAVVREKSVRAFRYELENALTLGAEFLVIHPGSYRGQTVAQSMATLARSIARAARGLKWDGLELLLENTAGGGMTLGRGFSELAELRERIVRRAGIPVAFCLDTAHCYEAGFDISTAEGLEETLQLADRNLGLENVRVLHVNDSKTALGSRADRHEHIGKGRLGHETFRRLLHDPRLADKPLILETPAVRGSHLPNVRALKALARSKK